MSFPSPFYRWRPHPWHGLSPGDEAPGLVDCYIEITPFDLVKYEVDKETGYLRVDRPQRTSSMPPSLYGFIPRTYCGPRVGALMEGAERGDGDPLDICVISERPIARAEVILSARIVGGLPMNDGGEADDKIIGVLANDAVWAGVRDISELPGPLIDRMLHYFRTYKMVPGGTTEVVIGQPYGRERAAKVIEASMLDYDEAFGSS